MLKDSAIATVGSSCFGGLCRVRVNVFVHSVNRSVERKSACRAWRWGYRIRISACLCCVFECTMLKVCFRVIFLVCVTVRKRTWQRRRHGYCSCPSCKTIAIQHLSLLQTIPNRKCTTQIFNCPDFSSFTHILINLNSFAVTSDAVTILYRTSQLTVNNWCTASLYFHFFKSIWQRHGILSVAYLLS